MIGKAVAMFLLFHGSFDQGPNVITSNLIHIVTEPTSGYVQVAKVEMITNSESSPSKNGAVDSLLADTAAALDACSKATQQGQLAESIVCRELEQCSRVLADLQADRANACKPPAPSQHLDERQSANSCITAEEKPAAATTGNALATAPSSVPDPALLAASSMPARSGMSKRLRKGWTGGPVGLTCTTHDSLPVACESAEQSQPAGVGVRPCEARAKRPLPAAAQPAEKCARTDAAVSCVSPAPAEVSDAQGVVPARATPHGGASTCAEAAPDCTHAPGALAPFPSAQPSCTPGGSSAAVAAGLLQGSPLKRLAPDTSTDPPPAPASAQKRVLEPQASPQVSLKPSIRPDGEQAIVAVGQAGDSDRKRAGGDTSEVRADLPAATKTAGTESPAAAPEPVAGPCTGPSVVNGAGSCAPRPQFLPVLGVSAPFPSVQLACNARGDSATAATDSVAGSQQGYPVKQRESAVSMEQPHVPAFTQKRVLEARASPQVAPQPPRKPGNAQAVAAVGEEGDSGQDHAGRLAPEARTHVCCAEQSVAMEPPAAAPAMLVGLSVAPRVKQEGAPVERNFETGRSAVALADPVTDLQRGAPLKRSALGAPTEQPEPPASTQQGVVQPLALPDASLQAHTKPVCDQVDATMGDERDSDRQHAGQETPEVQADVPSAQQIAAVPATEIGPSPAPRVKQEGASEESHIASRNSAAAAAGSVADLQRVSLVKHPKSAAPKELPDTLASAAQKRVVEPAASPQLSWQPAIKPENDQTDAAVGGGQASNRRRGRETSEVRVDVPSVQQSTVMEPMAAAPETVGLPSAGPRLGQGGGCPAQPGCPLFSFGTAAAFPSVQLSLDPAKDRAAAAADAAADLQRGSPPNRLETGPPTAQLKALDSEKKRVRQPQSLPEVSPKSHIRPDNDQAVSTVNEQLGANRGHAFGEMAEVRPDVPAAERSAATNPPAAPATVAGPSTGPHVKQEGAAEGGNNRGIQQHRAGLVHLSALPTALCDSAASAYWSAGL